MERADASFMVLAARANPGWRMGAARLASRLALTLLAGWLGLAGAAALAADAIVLSVAGTASAEGAPAAPGLRILQSGSELFEGDLVRTGDDGRVQFRFTDGGLVSLQPRTEFRIDEYRQGGANQRSFFSLLRGAIRTATGAIGRRDHDDYRLRTPTATVGIRGTEFLAEETVCDPRCAPGPTAGLRVSVTQGRIAVSTGAGSIEVGQGQSAVVDGPNALPRLSAAGPVLAPRALASAGQSPVPGGTLGRSPDGAATAASSSTIPGTADPAAAAAARQATGPGPRLAESMPSRSGSGSTPASTSAGATGEAGAGTSTAPRKTPPLAQSDGDWPADRPQPITVALTPTVPGLPLAPPSAGEATSSNNERGPNGELIAVTDALPDGGSPGGPGSGDPGSGDPGSGDPGSGDPGSGDPGSGDPGSGDPGSGDPGSGDPGSGDPGSGDPGSGDSDPGPGDPEVPPPLSGPGVIVKTGQLYLQNLPPVLVVFDWLPLTAIGGRYVLDDQGGLQSLGLDDAGRCTLLICLSRGSARLAEAQADAYASWGRWTDGTIDSHGAFGWAVLAPNRRLSSNQGLHYLVGVPSTTVPTSGQFGYSLLGATRPTFANGSASPGNFSGSAGVAFSPGQARIGLEGLVTIGGTSYNFATAGGARDPSLSALATDAARNFAFSGRSNGSDTLGCSGGSGCGVEVSGGLFGPEAARLGLSYEIDPTGRGSTISGVGVFQKQ